jgi:hypothetical protein
MFAMGPRTVRRLIAAMALVLAWLAALGHQAEAQRTASGEAASVYVRVQAVQLRLKPELKELTKLDEATFAQRLLVLNEQDDWLLVRRSEQTPPGWVHKLCVARGEADIKAIRASKRVPSLLIYMSDRGPGVLAGSVEVEGPWLSKLLPDQAVVFDKAETSAGGVPISGFLSGDFGPGDPKPGIIYILNARGRFEAWNAPKPR